MRVHVRPADPRATIPDPARGTDLPPEGREVDWSVHWARLEARKDVVVTEVPDGGAVVEPATDAPHAEPMPSEAPLPADGPHDPPDA